MLTKTISMNDHFGGYEMKVILSRQIKMNMNSINSFITLDESEGHHNGFSITIKGSGNYFVISNKKLSAADIDCDFVLLNHCEEIDRNSRIVCRVLVLKKGCSIEKGCRILASSIKYV